MSALYPMLETSRQAQQQLRLRRATREDELNGVLRMIRTEREEHPRMGLRKLFDMLHTSFPVKIGRDNFIALGMAEGLGIVPPKNQRRTTFSSGSRQFPNLLIGRKLNDVNQAWASDLTYYPIGHRFAYITFIMDMYSRLIVAATVARSMHAHWTVEAFEQAILRRNIVPAHRLIMHSDEGSQYTSEAHQAMATSVGALISTSEIVYENSHAERLNGIIKHEYLDAWHITTFPELQNCVNVAVERYNTTRPHGSLAKRSPIQFEASLLGIPKELRTELAVWPPQSLKKLSEGVTVPYKL